MKILQKSVHHINYGSHNCTVKELPESFDDYINELIDFITSNEGIRNFVTRSPKDEVIASIQQLINLTDKASNHIHLKIAERLLRVEIETQDKISHITNIQKGSLIQTLIHDENKDNYLYLLAKVEHKSFVDGDDFSYKTGFSKDTKRIWKTCILSVEKDETECFYAKIFSNNLAKYWTNEFLELDEITSNEKNTSSAFRALETMLTRGIKQYSKDYFSLRNALIFYFRKNEYFDYNTMIQEVFRGYRSIEIPQEKFDKFCDNLLDLPKIKNFDQQFQIVSKEITAKIKKTYAINEGIELKIIDAISNLEQTISSFRNDDGKMYIQIETNNQDIYKQFNVRK